MPQYKLNYFDLRGFGEPARIIFHYAGQEFEDRRWSRADWPAIKPTSETGASPWLEVDGERIYQSVAIARYLGHTFGLAGKDLFENAQIDSMVDSYKDYLNDARPFFWVKSGGGEGNLEELTKTFDDASQRWFSYLQKRLEKIGSGFIATKLSWGDLFLADGIKTTMNFDENFEKKFPKMVEYKNFVFSQPKIKEYIENRPESIF
uniref:Glutathione S-transferase n=1 Tax=Panagrolaimus sp. ES5 TaxID=591445 RepID=A0AC34GXU2_9BILA